MPKTKAKRSSSFYLSDTESLSTSISGNGNNDKHNHHLHQKFEKSGWLHKWTNYVKGYRQRWFVLKSGNLSYYRNPNEVNRSPRGSINLAEANIHCNPNEKNYLVITATGPSSQTFHLKVSNEIECINWLKALEYAKHHAIKRVSTLEDDEDESELFLLKSKDLKKLPTVDLGEMTKSWHALSGKFNAELNEFAHYAIGHMNTNEAKKCAEKLIPLRSLLESIENKTGEILTNYQQEYHALSRLANSQNEKYRELQKQYEILARQHSKLERNAFNSIKTSNAAATHTPSGDQTSSHLQAQTPPFVAEESDVEDLEEPDAVVDTEEVFHDATDYLEETRGSLSNNSLNVADQGSFEVNADEEQGTEATICRSESNNLMSSIMGKLDLSKWSVQMPSDLTDYCENISPTTISLSRKAKNYRNKIPPKPESHSLNLWSIMRNCIGKELTRIPIPVNFNEPLSMLQRITEDLEYSYLLDCAAEKLDICERLAYVAAFAISCYSATAKRTTKPFNPLLGETFELDRRDDLGWRSLVEQVSHHPPAAAHHVDGVQWVMHQEFMVSSRFRGKYLSVIPTGFTHVDFKDGKAMCTFQKITTTVHNIIVGKLWIDNHGEMNIINHVTGERAIIKFYAYSYFSSNRPRKVEGLVLNNKDEVKFYVEGYWDSYVNIAPVQTQKKVDGKLLIEAEHPKRIWTASPPLGDASMYYFSKLAIEMNEPDENVAPTDSRRRPDQRLMEDGKWDEANKRKNQLEDRQRKARRKAEADAERAMNNNQQPDEYEARWFHKVQDANIGAVIYMIRDDKYWKCKERQDWSICPDIYC